MHTGLVRVQAGGDGGVVLTEAAVDEARAARGAAADVEALLAALHAAGWLRHYRHLVLGPDAGGAELVAALELFTPVHRHVVATLWPVGDRPAARITARITADVVTRGAGTAAHALHRAIRGRRDRDPARSSGWAAPLHSGG